MQLTEAQVKELEAAFSLPQFPNQSSVLKLAAHLELTESQVQVREMAAACLHEVRGLSLALG